MDGARPVFIGFLEPIRAGMPEEPTDAQAEAVGAHFAYDLGFCSNRACW